MASSPADLATMSPAERHHAVSAFLTREARQLDTFEYDEWLATLTDDLVYRVPVRAVRERGADPFDTDGAHFVEDKRSLEKRVTRLQSDYVWAENPPSRIRHFVTNVEVDGVEGDEVDVRSYCLLYRSQGDSTEYDLLTYERDDTLRHAAGSLSLARRTVYLDQTALDVNYLSFFL